MSKQTHCKHGHDIAVVGRNTSGACRECHRASGRAWIKRNREYSRINQRKWVAANPTRAAWKSYRQSARLRGVNFDMSYHMFATRITQPCFYCGALARPINGLDRRDNNLGYVDENVSACCTICNLAKRNMTEKEFVSWALRLAHHLQTPADGHVDCCRETASS